MANKGPADCELKKCTWSFKRAFKHVCGRKNWDEAQFDLLPLKRDWRESCKKKGRLASSPMQGNHAQFEERQALSVMRSLLDGDKYVLEPGQPQELSTYQK